MSKNYDFSSISSTISLPTRAVVSDYVRSKGGYISTIENYNGNGNWWLRSPGDSGTSYGVKVVIYDGFRGGDGVERDFGGVRPAMTITLK